MRLANVLIGCRHRAVALALSALPSPAQNWPTAAGEAHPAARPGTGVDIGARLIADKLSAKWGQPVVVENRPGGDGIVAISAFIGAKDDHMLLMSPTSSFTAHPYLHDKLPYDPRDLAPIARISNTIVAVAVPSSLGHQDREGSGRRRRAPIPASSTGRPSPACSISCSPASRRRWASRSRRCPIATPVQAVNDLAEGRIQVMMSALCDRAAAGAGRRDPDDRRSPRASAPRSLPDVPTTTEAGYPDITIDGLIGVFGPRDMPAEVRERIAADVKAAAGRSGDHRAAASRPARWSIPADPPEFGAAIDAQHAQVAAAGELLGIKPASN